LCTAALNWPKSALSPVSLMPKKTYLPCGTKEKAPAGVAQSRQSSAAAQSAPAFAAVSRGQSMESGTWCQVAAPARAIRLAGSRRVNRGRAGA
jgi:hypothetical protein